MSKAKLKVYIEISLVMLVIYKQPNESGKFHKQIRNRLTNNLINLKISDIYITPKIL